MATAEQKVRVLIPDTEAVYEGSTLFSSDDITTYLEIANGNVLRAASYAVMAIASSEALISKVIKTQDLSTDGAKVSDALVKKAQVLAARADAEEKDANLFYLNIIDRDWSSTPELTEFGQPAYDEPGFGYGGFGN